MEWRYHEVHVHVLTTYLDDQHVDDPGVTNMGILDKFLSQPLSPFLSSDVQEVQLNRSRNLHQDKQ